MSASSHGTPLQPRQGDTALIPIIATAGDAIRFCLQHWRAFLIVASAPLAMSQVIWFASFTLEGEPWNHIVSDSLYILPATLFTVSWCRFVLFGPLQAPPAFIERWRRDHLRILVVHIVLTLIYLVTVYGGDFVFAESDTDESLWIPFVQLLLAIAVYSCVLRLSLAFCGAVTHPHFGLWRAWGLTRGYTLRLLFAVILAFVPLLVPAIGFDYAFEVWTGLSSQWPDSYRPPSFDFRLVLLSVGNSFFELVLSATQLVVVCSVFMRISGWRPPASPSLLERFD